MAACVLGFIKYFHIYNFTEYFVAWVAVVLSIIHYIITLVYSLQYQDTQNAVNITPQYVQEQSI